MTLIEKVLPDADQADGSRIVSLFNDRFVVIYDGDALTIECRSCGQQQHFAQGYVLANVAASAEAHVLAECGQRREP